MYRFHDAETDAEHDRIIRTFSELVEIVSHEAYDPAARTEVINLFLHYTTDHFHREEQVMAEAGYPHLEAHMDAHAAMQDTFQRLRACLSPGTPNLRSDLTLMRELLLEHILTLDDAFGAWRAAQEGVPR